MISLRSTHNTDLSRFYITSITQKSADREIPRRGLGRLISERSSRVRGTRKPLICSRSTNKSSFPFLLAAIFYIRACTCHIRKEEEKYKTRERERGTSYVIARRARLHGRRALSLKKKKGLNVSPREGKAKDARGSRHDSLDGAHPRAFSLYMYICISSNLFNKLVISRGTRTPEETMIRG